jgi:2-oxo-4-hydroxy-4-carboxy--5-ureidoimidazoline (OHCU) decarboxylase
VGVLLHQGIGLDAFNAFPERRAVHALYECCNSMTMARHLAHGRAYLDHDALFRRADALLFALPDSAIDQILDACPHVGRRPRSAKSQAEQCSVWDDDADVMAELGSSSRTYAATFGFGFVMYVDERLREEHDLGGVGARTVLGTVADRMHNDVETERKVVRNELAKINRSRLERMLGPEGGYHNW